jgi:hypothetical protein
MNYSPITVDRIKKAGGRTRIIQEDNYYMLQVQEGGVWTTVLTAPDRAMCEGAIRKASGNVIIG